MTCFPRLRLLRGSHDQLCVSNKGPPPSRLLIRTSSFPSPTRSRLRRAYSFARVVSDSDPQPPPSRLLVRTSSFRLRHGASDKTTHARARRKQGHPTENSLSRPPVHTTPPGALPPRRVIATGPAVVSRSGRPRLLNATGSTVGAVPSTRVPPLPADTTHSRSDSRLLRRHHQLSRGPVSTPLTRCRGTEWVTSHLRTTQKRARVDLGSNYSEATPPRSPYGQHQLRYSPRLFTMSGRSAGVEKDA